MNHQSIVDSSSGFRMPVSFNRIEHNKFFSIQRKSTTKIGGRCYHNKFYWIFFPLQTHIFNFLLATFFTFNITQSKR